MKLFNETLSKIEKTNEKAGQEAQKRLDSLTKPPGSLGILEKVAVQLAKIQGKAMPTIGNKVVMTMAGDHGVTEEGVSPFPQEVTLQMVLNFLNNGAAINVLSNHVDAKVVVTDVGITADPIEHPNLNNCKVRRGTRNMAKEPAMTLEETIAAIEVGIKLVNEQIDKGATLVATGEMGIGNTTPSSAILACYSNEDIIKITGRGTGLDNNGLTKKQQVIKRAIEINKPNPDNPLDVLQKVGGLEIAALTGVIIGAAARKTPVVIDGFISTAAALIAYKMNNLCREYMLASHLSQEPGHKAMLDLIGLTPMLYLDLRLGEGTGAVLAFNLVEAAVKIIHEMATFEEAGVSNRK
ncbi:MAG: nicotinate-nucleotide--dimethylbenzimidazole phosphoribosyltransferase [Zhaonellaceae bacterium]|jgi:nicotinate-nucleotide--dimethylbenzimidazole phosphoribosyltransferase|nr:nicotinate-nucleotide--dimethylbenzimidazole phosphoribosyltransferase [Clostridia bacterium]